MRKKTFLVSAVGAAVLLVAGGLFASNMGFKLNYELTGPVDGTPEDGTNVLALPFNQQTDLAVADDLGLDIGGYVLPANGGGNDCGRPEGPVVNLQRYVKADGGLSDLYTGCAGVNFDLIPAEHYRIKTDATVSYIVVGSHDPSLLVSLTGNTADPEEDGTNTYGYPYHSVASTADELGLELGGYVLPADGGGNDCGRPVGEVINLQRYVKGDGGLSDLYTGCAGTDFALRVGEGYRIKVKSDISFIPAHY